jgi:hypothetical protein
LTTFDPTFSIRDGFDAVQPSILGCEESCACQPMFINYVYRMHILKEQKDMKRTY